MITILVPATDFTVPYRNGATGATVSFGPVHGRVGRRQPGLVGLRPWRRGRGVVSGKPGVDGRQPSLQTGGECGLVPAVHDDRGPRVLQNEQGFRYGQPGIDRHPDRAELPAGVEGFEGRGVVGAEPGDAGAADHAEGMGASLRSK